MATFPERLFKRVRADEARSPRFELREPLSLSSGAVFSSPHSGRAYFPGFVRDSRLSAQALRASEDAYVDALLTPVPDFGAPLLTAVAPRAYLDLNRAPSDLDPALVEGCANRPANARVSAGLGVVPRVVAEGIAIYDRKLSKAEAQGRVNRWHRPYHQQLEVLLRRAREAFDSALLVDVHSMPAGAGKLGRSRFAKPVDMIIGDRFGASAHPDLTSEIETLLRDAGFQVARNTPFAGGYITERYGHPSMGVSAVQIEIDRGLYLNPTTVEPNAGFEELRHALIPALRQICILIGRPSSQTSLAAE
ncbi:MAG: N-formylglutamate amidohydrolase [Neomegalonema sp.]|nr:N-formylglutamate amidohydrolase [Neomegalonema sp.]